MLLPAAVYIAQGRDPGWRRNFNPHSVNGRIGMVGCTIIGYYACVKGYVYWKKTLPAQKLKAEKRAAKMEMFEREVQAWLKNGKSFVKK